MGKKNCQENNTKNKDEPISERWGLTIEEAAVHFCIGENKLRELTEKNTCPFVLRNGIKRVIKRKLLEDYLNEEFYI